MFIDVNYSYIGCVTRIGVGSPAFFPVRTTDRRHYADGMLYHQYADDMHLYCHFDPNSQQGWNECECAFECVAFECAFECLAFECAFECKTFAFAFECHFKTFDGSNVSWNAFQMLSYMNGVDGGAKCRPGGYRLRGMSSAWLSSPWCRLAGCRPGEVVPVTGTHVLVKPQKPFKGP